MVGRKPKNDVRNRLGKRDLTTAKPKTNKIRDARDILKGKKLVKGRLGNLGRRQGRPEQLTNMTAKARIRRLMPLKNLLSETKTVKFRRDSTSKSKPRTLSLSNGSLRITSKQPELCRRAILSSNSLKVVTPTNSLDQTDVIMSDLNPQRTLTNDSFRTTSSSHDVREDDLRSSSSNLSFTLAREDGPLFSKHTHRSLPDASSKQKELTKIVVTNLHPHVVQEDIAELFGAVGPLSSVKLENTVADVVFVKASDAEIAYHKYHNRMLDGRAMKCTLGLASTGAESSKAGISLNYSGAELVYPSRPSRPVVFQVRI